MKLKDMTAADVIEHFPPIDEALRRELSERYIPKRIFLIDKCDLTRAWCSVCQEEVTLSRPLKRGIKYLDHCPRCGSVVESGRLWAKSGVRNRVLVLRYEEFPGAEKTFGARLIYLERDWRGSAYHLQDVQVQAAADSYYIFRFDEGGIEVAPERGRALNFAWQGNSVDYTVRKKVSWARWGAYVTLGGRKSTKNFVDISRLEEAVRHTPFRYIWAAVRRDLRHAGDGLRLFYYAAKYPFATECLAKMGPMPRSVMLDVTERGRPSYGAINWRGTTVQQVFKTSLSKMDKTYLRNTDEKIDFAWALAAWQKQKKQGIFLQLEDFISLGFSHTQSACEIAECVNLYRAARYIKKQIAICGGEAHIDATIYRDYLHQCAILNMDLQKKSVLFPKNLLRQHENLSRQIAYQKSETKRKTFVARAPLWEARYAYAEAEYSIVIPKSPQDLIDEGSALNHCVGSYIDRVAEGETDIFFIRPTKDLASHLATMEVQSGHIVQARTKNNGKLPKDVEAFVERFRETVLEQEGRSRIA